VVRTQRSHQSHVTARHAHWANPLILPSVGPTADTVAILWPL
jgi:hypothetical protein